MAVPEWIDKRIAEVVQDIRDDEVKRIATMLEYLAEQTTSAGAGQGLGFAAQAVRKGEHRGNYEKDVAASGEGGA